MSDDPIINLFGFAIAGWVICLFIAAFKHHDPKRRAHVSELIAQQKSLTQKLLKVSIDQMFALNKMLASGSINEVNYEVERDIIIHRLINANIDPSPVLAIPKPNIPNIQSMLDETIIIANELHNSNQLSTEEFEKHIDQALDEKKKLGYFC